MITNMLFPKELEFHVGGREGPEKDEIMKNQVIRNLHRLTRFACSRSFARSPDEFDE